MPEAVAQQTPESLFERRLASSPLAQVIANLRVEFTGMGKAKSFDELSILLNSDGPSTGALRVAVYRMRQRYRDLLRAEIAETGSRPAEIDEGIRFLLSALRI